MKEYHPNTPYFYCTMRRGQKLEKRSAFKKEPSQEAPKKPVPVESAPPTDEELKRVYIPRLEQGPPNKNSNHPPSLELREIPGACPERRRSFPERRDRETTELQYTPRQVDRAQSPGRCEAMNDKQSKCGKKSQKPKNSSDNSDGAKKSFFKKMANTRKQSDSSNDNDAKRNKKKRQSDERHSTSKQRKSSESTSPDSESESDTGSSSSTISVHETQIEVKIGLGQSPQAKPEKAQAPSAPTTSTQFKSRIARISYPDKSNPLPLMQEWLNTAKMRCHYIYANCMNVATITKDGRPCNRYILMREFKDGCYYFVTAKSSRKYAELKGNKYVGVSFLWVFIDDEHKTICRQVRIEGVVEELDHEYTESIFRRMPRIEKFKNQFCTQGQEVTWEDFEFRHNGLLRKVKDNIEIIEDMPDNLVTFKVTPHSFEFFNVIGDGYNLPDRLWFNQMEDGTWEHSHVET